MSWTFDRTGDHLALDFANTVSRRKSPSPIERIESYADLIEFARQTEIITESQAKNFKRRGAQHPTEAANAHRDALALRDAFYSAFLAISGGELPQARDLEVVNLHLGKLRLEPDLSLGYCCGDFDSVLGPIVHAGLELLTGDRDRVKICAADTCAFLFLDLSKNGSRRWCDMKQCGNREKARRHREQ
jgi:predicted RNA-binding Zn ribbon-like protein